MKKIILNWKFGGTLNNYNIPPNENGVYMHILRGRIIYVGEGNVQECQNRHYTKMRNRLYSYYNLPKIDDNNVKDIYSLITNNNYQHSYEEKYIYDQMNTNQDNNAENIIIMNLKETCIYYSIINDNQISANIEPALQKFLILKYSMDSYGNDNYIIGYCNNNRNQYDEDLEIINNFENSLLKMNITSDDYL